MSTCSLRKPISFSTSRAIVALRKTDSHCSVNRTTAARLTLNLMPRYLGTGSHANYYRARADRLAIGCPGDGACHSRVDCLNLHQFSHQVSRSIRLDGNFLVPRDGLWIDEDDVRKVVLFDVGRK